MSAPTASASHSAKVSKDYIESVTKSRKFTGSAASARLLRAEEGQRRLQRLQQRMNLGCLRNC